jgi:membrane-associated PAP2 superfamily phosphatase
MENYDPLKPIGNRVGIAMTPPLTLSQTLLGGHFATHPLLAMEDYSLVTYDHSHDRMQD